MSESQEKAARRELRRTVGEDVIALINRHGGQLTALGLLIHTEHEAAATHKIALGQLQRDHWRVADRLDALEVAARRFAAKTLWQRVRWICGGK